MSKQNKTTKKDRTTHFSGISTMKGNAQGVMGTQEGGNRPEGWVSSKWTKGPREEREGTEGSREQIARFLLIYLVLNSWQVLKKCLPNESMNSQPIATTVNQAQDTNALGQSLTFSEPRCSFARLRIPHCIG